MTAGLRDLAGRAAVVTGAAGGLGTAICAELRALGADVLGVDVVPGADLVLDAAGEDENRAMVDEALQRFGRLDILALNAGLQHVAPIAEFPPAEWDRLMAVMVRGPFLAMQAGWSSLTERPGGRIVVTASVSSFVAELYKSAYVAAKHAVVGLVKVAALEGAPHGLTANAVAPGLMLTGMIERQLADQVRLRGRERAEILATMTAESPANRAVETTEVARLVGFLASPASSGVNGACVPVDLGALAW